MAGKAFVLLFLIALVASQTLNPSKATLDGKFFFPSFTFFLSSSLV